MDENDRMINDQIISALQHISDNVNEIKISMASVQTIVSQHEKRIEKLEDRQDSTAGKDDSFKNQLMLLLAKCVIAALGIVGTLNASTAAISKILGQ